MSIDFKLPAVGENIQKADIGNVLVKEGDVISADQIVVEVETDKAVFELPCPHAGKILKVHIKSGQSVNVGQTLLTIEETSGAASSPPAAAPSAPAKAPEKAAAKTASSPAPTTSASANPSRTSAPASPAPARASAAVAAPEAAPTNGEGQAPAPAGPATRRLARELGVDLHRVAGTGPGGRITAEDVQAFVRQLTSGAAAAGGGGGLVVPPLPDFSQWGAVDRQPLNKLTRTAAANLSLSWQVIPHVTQHEWADITDLEAGRRRFTQARAKLADAPKVTMTVLALKALVSVLKAFPNFNASFSGGTGEIILKRYYHIGVAVDTEQGLLVPIVRDVDRKSTLEIATELTELAGKARARKLSINEMQGGTFTVTNLGGIGGAFFTPIINYPEVAILGMSRSVQQQVIIDGKPEIRLMLPLSLSYDHRVINGADAARFMVKLSSLLSDPFELLSEV